VDGENDRLHQTCNLRSSCRIGIQADQVSLEKCSPFAKHRILLEQIQNGIENMPLGVLHFLGHLGEKFHKFDHFSLFVVDCLIPFDHCMYSTQALKPFLEVELRVHNLKGLATSD
jgi:hypothetical protein